MNHLETDEKIIFDVIRLITSVLNGEIPDRAWCESLEMDALYRVSHKHLLDAMVAEALERAGIQNETFHRAKAKAIQNNLLFRAERKKIFEEFERQKIWYMPLKGILLQDYYPGFGLRQMADNDILIDADRTEDVKIIMEKLGYDTLEYGDEVHDTYQKKPIFLFEMHVNLFAKHTSQPLYEYYHNTRDRLIKDVVSSCQLHFSKEDLYIYLIAHEYRHFINYGTGLRSLLDVYLFLKRESLDWTYVTAETEKLGISSFEKKNRQLADRLFTGEELSEEDSDMLESFMKAGAYGNTDLYVANMSRQHGWGKIRYSLYRFSVPINPKNIAYDDYKRHFPFFYKYKIFLPFLPIYRMLRAIKGKRFKTELKAMKDI